MKKLLFFSLLSLFIFFLSFSVIYSQGQSDYDKLYQEYSLKAEVYRRAHEEYILARSQYLKFQTLTSQNNAKEKTIAMIIARDDVIINYIRALKEKLKETPGIADATRDSLNVRFDDEISWYEQHKGRVANAGTLDDLVSDSDEAEARYEASSPLIYEALSVAASGRISRFRERLSDTFTAVHDKVNQIREEEREGYTFSTRKLEIIDRWIFDTENRIARSQDKQQEAQELISEFISFEGKSRASRQYSDVLELLGESQQYMKDASLFVKEIIREIKTED